MAERQISVKPSSGGVTIAAPGNGATLNWPTTLQASANPGISVPVMRVLIDGQQAYADNGDTLNTSLKVNTGTHQITVQSLDNAGNTTASASLNVDAEPDDIPPVAGVTTIHPLTSISPTTVLGCTAASTDADGFGEQLRVGVLQRQAVHHTGGGRNLFRTRDLHSHRHGNGSVRRHRQRVHDLQCRRGNCARSRGAIRVSDAATGPQTEAIPAHAAAMVKSQVKTGICSARTYAKPAG